MNTKLLRTAVNLISVVLFFLLTACGVRTISDLNIDFDNVDAIRIQTMEQVEKSNPSALL